MFLPVSLTTFVLSIVVGRVMHRTSPRLLIGSGMLFIAAGVLAQTVLDAGSGWAALLPGLFLVGVGAGLVLGPLSAAAMAAVPGPRAGMAAGAVNTFRQLGYALGVAVLGQVFRSGLDSDDLHRAYANALDRTFVVAASFAVFAGVAVFLFVRDGQRRGGLVPVRRMVSRWVSPTARS